ncbi:alkane 1-monooxygenase [Phaeovulum sp. W22_SRMD_FR3]|uniref:alkane 1-monooxygenase n=1 Tax=Phaeovulum sp. W22_SRMD_FR3 TaxID=3240274 RepID=UPI003F9E518E
MISLPFPRLASLRGLLRRPAPIRLFAGVTLAPIPLLLAAGFWGGGFALAAFLYIAVFLALFDHLAGAALPDAPEGAEFPAADRLSVTLALVHFPLLVLGVAALSGATGLGWGSRVLIFLSYGLFFGQVSNSNAHELIHRSSRGLQRLGAAVYTSLLFGHHSSAHRLVHHRFVATDDDPNSAALGESFYAFAPRAWRGSFTAGYEMEAALRRRITPHEGRFGRRMRGHLRRVNPYLFYVTGAVAVLAAATLGFGAGGLVALIALAGYAQMQLLLSDYVQHYGLRRRDLGMGQHEPVGPAHSWDAPQPASSLWMLNAPRHGDHHAHPARPYPALRLRAEAGPCPTLPYSLPVMATLALFPRLFRRVMAPRLAALRPTGR